MKGKARVLFVCVENSCRSQMAEGLANKLGQGVLEAFSAGSRPSGKINETAAKVMKERAVDLSRQHSKSLADLPKGRWDYVVTMGCGEACPIVPAREKLDWNIPDPKNMPLKPFRLVADQIERELLALLERISRNG